VGFLEMLELDVEYARGHGPLLDLRILLRTPAALVGRTA
jgi:lipopolysaccharide/colanic/teichoic acid biosynthesis glycosyltransferase